MLLLKYELFLESKKRGLSDKSQNGEDSKKKTENNVSASSLPNAVFGDGYNLPECAKLLVNFLKSIELHVKEHFLLYKDTENSHVKGERQLYSHADGLQLLSAKFDELENSREKNDQIKKNN